MSKIRALIFDYYGTLIDIQTNEWKEEIFYYLSLYLHYYGATIDAEKLRDALAQEREHYFHRMKQERYPELDLEIVFENVLKKEGLTNPFLAESCCKLFRMFSRERFQLFPDSVPVLKQMKESGYLLAVVSDAQKVFSLEESRMLGLTPFFKHIILSTSFGFKKPDSRLFAVACALLEISPMNAVYIGNNAKADIKGAKEIGMQAILVTRDQEYNNHEIKPDFNANSLWEAWEWVKRSSLHS
jgi:putative hydrolase of the HAD superfamily